MMTFRTLLALFCAVGIETIKVDKFAEKKGYGVILETNQSIYTAMGVLSKLLTSLKYIRIHCWDNRSLLNITGVNTKTCKWSTLTLEQIWPAPNPMVHDQRTPFEKFSHDFSYKIFYFIIIHEYFVRGITRLWFDYDVWSKWFWGGRSRGGDVNGLTFKWKITFVTSMISLTSTNPSSYAKLRSCIENRTNRTMEKLLKNAALNQEKVAVRLLPRSTNRNRTARAKELKRTVVHWDRGGFINVDQREIAWTRDAISGTSNIRIHRTGIHETRITH